MNLGLFMGNETSKSLGVLLEINFGNPCGAALSTEDRAWSVIDSIVGSSECAHFVLEEVQLVERLV